MFHDYYGYGTYVVGTRSLNWIIEEVQYGIEKKVNIISISLSTIFFNKLRRKVIKKAVTHNILIVCAAENYGNHNSLNKELDYPECLQRSKFSGSNNFSEHK
ncbi:hypothetical protein BAGA_18430 [Bacillus gaemokensis]|uniref:Uncharacterized protein n=1 Tax=Bacillus gaemokensis TaxID=574375 RepID=A0A073KER7_9BACI|nr:hypothetical protein BAGA_18430 [Bacillus gaemokensis]KYG32548.1 hypothetical protein AZF08_10580 [Bacillus gaemokensis]